jgi:GGDEF domain-containing protein
MGGDEFIVILEGLHSRLDAAAAAQKISSACNFTLPLDGDREIAVTTSIGVVLFPQ